MVEGNGSPMIDLRNIGVLACKYKLFNYTELGED
jgi:hypothetical protein